MISALPKNNLPRHRGKPVGSDYFDRRVREGRTEAAINQCAVDYENVPTELSETLLLEIKAVKSGEK